MSDAKPVDLWGEPITSPAPPPIADGKRRKTKLNGYAASPGSGPKNETCRTCEHYARVGGHAKTYRKCFLVRARWTNGPGTDIKASAPACAYWERAKPEPNASPA